SGPLLLAADRMVPRINEAEFHSWESQGLAAFSLNPLDFSSTRVSTTYGPRGLTFDPKLGQYLLAFTDFQGTSLNGSYLLFLDSSSGQEVNAFSIQEGSQVANVRGMEYDPRGSGNSAWMTILNSGNSAKIVKIALADGPAGAIAPELMATPSPIAFAMVDTGTSMTINVELHNTGGATDTIAASSIVPSGTAYSFAGITFPVVLNDGDSMKVSVTFAPHSLGEQDAELAVTQGSEEPTVSFPITGEGIYAGESVAEGVLESWQMTLSPNPARDNVELTLDAAEEGPAKIFVYDATGREVRSIDMGTVSEGEHETQISTGDLPSGMYFVRALGASGQLAASRLVIAR
ncbi:MAG TPA: T9SS type A sorting domain-containing protein, partial [Candidatus Kapabacteria bacterium]